MNLKLNTLLFLFLMIAFSGLSQKSTVYEIETLTPPKKLLTPTKTVNFFDNFDFDVEKSSITEDQIISMGEHPFLEGYVEAYQKHRPIVINPDAFWLIIAQGFSIHVGHNSEALRSKLVQFEGKKTLTIISEEIQIGNPNSNWESAFPQFTKQISDYTGKEFCNTMTADFSTTTPITRMTSQITLMNSVKNFFDYAIDGVGCGLPRVTIEGTVEDWEKVLAKTQSLSQYDLKWWTSELEPILKNIIKAKKGTLDKKFWTSMVKYHDQDDYGNPLEIDGWIIKFFPYNVDGIKSEFKPIPYINAMPSELVRVPFIFTDLQNKKQYKMEFCAGFIGMEQNETDFTVNPKIGWIINRTDIFEPNIKNNYDDELENLSINNVAEIPEEVFRYQKINILHISFSKEINIPTRMVNLLIGTLDLEGTITATETARLKEQFPNVNLIINGVKQ